MKTPFIKFTGLKGQLLTINSQYLIRYEPYQQGTLIYIDDKVNVISYPVTMSYEQLNALLDAIQ